MIILIGLLEVCFDISLQLHSEVSPSSWKERHFKMLLAYSPSSACPETMRQVVFFLSYPVIDDAMNVSSVVQT